MNVPSELKYSTTDEWVKIDNNIATVGISDFAQDSLSDIVFWEAIVDVGEDVTVGSTVASLESVKAAADVNTPISGKVVEINEDLTDEFEVINSDPYGKAWMVKIEMSDPKEVDSLMDAAAYETDTQERGH